MIIKTKQRLSFFINSSSGIGVSYNKSKEELFFSGWHDIVSTIKGESISFINFCNFLGVEKKTLEKVLDAVSEKNNVEWEIPQEIKERTKQKADYWEKLKESLKKK